MSGIRAAGIGSGLDINSIISQLMALERRPLVSLQTRQLEVKTQISAYGSLKSALDAFRSTMDELDDPARFEVTRAVPSDPTVLTATSTSAAARGSYSFEVLRLAENHRLASAAFADPAATTIGTTGDTFTLSVAGQSFVIDYGGRTLNQVRDAINAVADQKGVTASIIRDDAGARLLVSADATGSAGAITLTPAAAGPFAFTTLNADRDAVGGFTTADLDAQLRFEGAYTVTRSSNSVSDVVEGVTLNLVKAGTSRLDVQRDTASVQASVNGMVRAYNGVIEAVNKMRADRNLRSDAAVLASVPAQLRSELNRLTGASTSFRLPAELGISTQKDGTLSVNGTVLGRALETDFSGVAAMFSAPEDGLAVRFRALADRMLDAGGIVDGRTTSLQRQDRDLAGRVTSVERRLADKERALIAQYSQLDATLTQLQSTSSALTQSLAQVTAAGQQRSG